MSRMTSGRTRFKYSLQPSYCGTPEIPGGQVPRLDHRSHRPVEDEDSPLECLAKKRSALGRLHAVILTSPGVPSRARPGLLLHYAAMAADGPKSAFELAMERLRQKDKEAGVDEHPLTDAQKAAIAEARQVYEARVAEREILHQAALRKATTYEEVERLNEEFRRDKDRLATDRDRKTAEARRAAPG